MTDQKLRIDTGYLRILLEGNCYPPGPTAEVVRRVSAHEELLAVVKDIVEHWKGNQNVSQSALIGGSDDPIGYRALQAIARAEGKA